MHSASAHQAEFASLPRLERKAVFDKKSYAVWHALKVQFFIYLFIIDRRLDSYNANRNFFAHKLLSQTALLSSQLVECAGTTLWAFACTIPNQKMSDLLVGKTGTQVQAHNLGWKVPVAYGSFH